MKIKVNSPRFVRSFSQFVHSFAIEQIECLRPIYQTLELYQSNETKCKYEKKENVSILNFIDFNQTFMLSLNVQFHDP